METGDARIASKNGSIGHEMKSRMELLQPTAQQYRLSPVKYLRGYVVKDFQRMIRAEAGADVTIRLWSVKCMSKIESGMVACVTCSTVKRWDEAKSLGNGGMDSGHFTKGRDPSTLLIESNCHPQCVSCNRWHDSRPKIYREYMLLRYGQEEVDRLEQLKKEVRTFDIDELVGLRVGYMDRVDAAVEMMRDD